MDDFYDLLANSYDELHGEEQWVKYEFIANYIDLALPAMILDDGCGTGILYEYLSSNRGRPGQYVCLDPSIGMLKKAHEKLKDPLVIFINAYAEELPFRDSVFDYVFAITVWNNILGKTESLLEMKRVVKPRGLIVVSSRVIEPIMPPDIDKGFTYAGVCIDYFYVNQGDTNDLRVKCVYNHYTRRYEIVLLDITRD